MTSIYRVNKSHGVAGTVDLPGDKSIAHRAAILAAMAKGESTVANYPKSADPESTLSALSQLGVEFERSGSDIIVSGTGVDGFRPPPSLIDCGNSGTTMRLLAGVLAGCPFESTLIGDESLSKRPMERIAVPLRQMGASIELTDGLPPVRIRGGNLAAIDYTTPVASAQVKSCVLLAGLTVGAETTVTETSPTRDHTERMLGLPTVEMGSNRIVTVSSSFTPEPDIWVVPHDFSAAAFFIGAGLAIPDSKLVLQGVGVNPSRTGFLSIVHAMGGLLTIVNERSFAGEPIADIGIESSVLDAVTVPEDLVPNLIDEIPILAVLATQASGTTSVRGAGELRVKECDRIHAIVSNLRTLGADITEYEDGFDITGPVALHGAEVDSFGDHRIAMAMAVAGLLADGETVIGGSDAAVVSFPGFWQQLERASVRL